VGKLNRVFAITGIAGIVSGFGRGRMEEERGKMKVMLCCDGGREGV